eukprot:12373394-Alexandrium_andersonii.AAC.1
MLQCANEAKEARDYALKLGTLDVAIVLVEKMRKHAAFMEITFKKYQEFPSQNVTDQVVVGPRRLSLIHI